MSSGSPPHALVTGAAGFIGSTLADRLLADGVRVTGVDAFTDYYDPALKRRNVSAALGHRSFTLLELDLATADLGRLPDVDVVFHQAAQPGVRASWGREFSTYTQHNVLATQRLDPNFQVAFFDEFAALWDMGRREEAVEVLQRWVERHPEDSKGFMQLQQARAMLGQGGGAPSPIRAIPPPRLR